VYGGLRWAQEIRERVEKPIANFKHIEHSCMKSLEAEEMFRKYEEMLKLLNR